MERWQRPLDEALERFAGLQGAGGSSGFQLSPLVSFVVSMGRDRCDLERPVFWNASRVAPGAGNVVKFSLEARRGAIELVSGYAVGDGNRLEAWLNDVPVTAGFLPENFSTHEGAVDNGVFGAQVSGVGLGIPTVFGVNFDMVDLRVAGMLLPLGRAIALESTVGANVTACGFSWRSIAGDR
jgi:hypothetical protein